MVFQIMHTTNWMKTAFSTKNLIFFYIEQRGHKLTYLETFEVNKLNDEEDLNDGPLLNILVNLIRLCLLL